MEDTEMLFRMVQFGKTEQGLSPQGRSVIRKILRSLQDIILYDDSAWNKMTDEQKSRKIDNEANAIHSIIKGKSLMDLEDDLSIPKDKRDFIM